jgi:acetolactate synthase-1/2/3 large subunit
VNSKTPIGNPPQNGAEYLVRFLCENGVDTVFGYPGGAIMPIYDALTRFPIRHILNRHEQASAFSADAWGRVTGKPGVCLATSGPGATNLITGIANAAMDSVPMIAITGQVSTALMGSDAFQEVDIFGSTLPLVKHSYIVREVSELPGVLKEAFEIAASGRPGPVLIDIPKDVQLATLSVVPVSSVAAADPVVPDEMALAEAEALIAAAERPLFYVGGGVGMADATALFRDLVLRTDIPCVATLKGLGALPADSGQFLGMLGMHGSRAANTAVQETDLLICVGARFDDRATGKLSSFAIDAGVIHMDIDAAEIDKLRTADVALVGDLASVLKGLNPARPAIEAWRQRCYQRREQHAPRYDAPGDHIYAPALLKGLTDQGPENLVLACDVGQHQMWVAQHCAINDPRAHLTSGGLGAMGYGIPAGIGAKLARPEAPVVVVTGDGSAMMNIQELSTLRRYDIDLKIVLLDNSRLGLVRQWQELFFDENYSETDLSDNPDFAALARTFGIEGFSISARDEVGPGLERLFASKGPCLMHVLIDPSENVWPLVPAGQSNSEMLESKP